MLKATRDKILAQHVDQVLLLSGLRKVPVTDIQACEVSDGFAWIPSEFDLDGYIKILHCIGVWLYREEEDALFRNVKAWEWALDTSRFQYKRFYKTAALDFAPVTNFLMRVEAKIG